MLRSSEMSLVSEDPFRSDLIFGDALTKKVVKIKPTVAMMSRRFILLWEISILILSYRSCLTEPFIIYMLAPLQTPSAEVSANAHSDQLRFLSQ